MDHNQIFFSINIFFWLLNKKFDVIDVAHFVFLNCYAAKLISYLKRTPLVFTWQQHFGKEYLSEMHGNIIGTIAAAFEKQTLKFSLSNIASSEIVRRDLVKEGICKEHIEVIYNGIDKSMISEATPFKTKKFDVIFVGRLVYQKNPELLIRAVHLLLKDFPKIKVCIIGEGYKMPKLLHLTKIFGIRKNIYFVGEIKDRKKVFRYLKSSKIFVLPSVFEGFPLTTLEACACGIPIVVAGSKWNRATNFVNGNGLTAEATPKGLAMAVRKLLLNNQLLKKMGEKGKRIASKFDFDELATQTEIYYEKTIKCNNA